MARDQVLRVTRDFNATFGYRHYVYSAAIRETLIKSDNDLISISLRNCSKRSFATEILLARAELCEGRGTGDKTGRWT